MGCHLWGRTESDTTEAAAACEEELKSLLIKARKESERAVLKLNIKKNLRSWHLAHNFMANRRGSSDRFPLLEL